jgi:hypothetical protein
MNAEKASTVLWNGTATPVQPDSVLSGRELWLDRGLYYYRTGWQSGMSSHDVVFSFYSGKFHGGHAQEDQNQFTLYGYGEKFVIDHGSQKQSEAHNMVFIDGAGQHNAGGSIGTDGYLAEHLMSDLADYLLGDATDAYTTHSEFNDPDVPFPGIDWSWGYVGANPVDHAYRRVVVVHHEETPPYFVMMDDIDKDGQSHTYQWRLHTYATNTVNTAANPLRISGNNGTMDLHVLYPDFTSLSVATTSYNNQNADPDGKLLKLSVTEVNPRYSFLLFPYDSLVTAPVASREVYPWGWICTLDWGGGLSDILVGNHSGELVTCGDDSILTDATFVLLRQRDSAVTGYLLSNVSIFDFRGVDYIRRFDGTFNCSLSDDVVQIDAEDAQFRIVDTGINHIECRGEDVVFARAGGYVAPDELVGVADYPVRAAAVVLHVDAYPNPFNPFTTINVRVETKMLVTAAVYDVRGRRVATLLHRELGRGNHLVRWNGRDRYGRRVSSGVYLLKVSGGGRIVTKKLTVLK